VPINQARARKGRGARADDAVHLESFRIDINNLLALTHQ